MTVIIGPNNSNKTYIAYSVYGLWKTLRRRFRSSLELNVEKQSPNPKDLSNATHNQTIFVVNVNQAFLDKISGRLQSVAEVFRAELGTYFQDSSQKIFSSTFFGFELSHQEILDRLIASPSYSLVITNNEINYSYEVNYQTNQILVRWENPDIRVIDGFSEFSPAGNEEEAQTLVSIAVMALLFNALFPDAFLLPAERNAFIITYKMLETRRYKFLREVQRRRRDSTEDNDKSSSVIQEEDPVRYPQPVEDFLDFLTDVEDISTRPRPQTKKSKIFARVADMIEESIQNGNKMTYRPTVLGGKEIIINVGNDINIDLYNASSSIKQLAPLLLYLRYRARENDLLIIDEPEMNLHPESQAKLMEALAILVNNGIHVLLTTHSPYIMAHLNNLTQEEEKPQSVKKRQAKSLYLKNAESLLNMDQVSAYEMRDNQLHSLKDADYGIRWDTLSDVSVDLQQKYFEIYEEGYAKEKTKAARGTA